ncbi:hypothetical protein PFISCL1PPCAC_21076, partial [Pristionchus fissidentatus]
FQSMIDSEEEHLVVDDEYERPRRAMRAPAQRSMSGGGRGGGGETDGGGSTVVSLSVSVAALKQSPKCASESTETSPWRLSVQRQHNADEILIELERNRELKSSGWSIEASVDFRIVNHRNPSITMKQILDHNFHPLSLSVSSIIDTYPNMITAENGFVKDDKILFEAQIVVKKVEGIRSISSSSLDFSSPSEILDVALVVEGGAKVYAGSQFLSTYSPYFRALFYDEMREKKEMKMDGIRREELVELLEVIYPVERPITNKNVEGLLKLAGRFEMKTVLNASEQFLISSSSVTPSARLLLADRYRLAQLQSVCLSMLDSKVAIKSVRDSNEYEKLSEKTKEALFDRMMEIV